MSNDTTGRWPANVAHDGSDEVEAGMPVTKPGHSAYSDKFKQRDGIASPGGAENPNNQKGWNEGYAHLESAGSASRYFFSPDKLIHHKEKSTMTTNTEIINACCLDHLPKMPDNSIDAIITDPPYEIGIVGANWDNAGVAYAPGVWLECLRVLKPGGHLLAFGGTRTYHRLACAVEDAGFEVRDVVSWLYGSGFPKSHNVGRVIAAQRTLHENEQLFCEWLKSTGLTPDALPAGYERFWTGEHITVNTATTENPRYATRANIPTGAVWQKIKDALPTPPPKQLDELLSQRHLPSTLDKERVFDFLNQQTKKEKSAAKKSDAEWAGWGTALKPGMELVVLARKPISEKTVALNVKRWRTGAINIDDCRIPYGDEPNQTRKRFQSVQRRTHDKTCDDDNEILTRPGPDRGYTKAQARKLDAEKRTPPDEEQGRWPANVAHDGSGEVEAGMPVGVRDIAPAKSVLSDDDLPDASLYGNKKRSTKAPQAKHIASASRYFYCAKAARSEREAGLDDIKDDTSKRANTHPAVKPLELMRWLCRMITPPDGVVLDPFAGSGTTIIAAHLEGFDGIGIEQDEKFAAIAAARLKYWKGDLT